MMEPRVETWSRYRLSQLRRAERVLVEPVAIDEARVRWSLPSHNEQPIRERRVRIPQRIIGLQQVPVSFHFGQRGAPWWDAFARAIRPGDVLALTWLPTETAPPDAQPVVSNVQRLAQLTAERHGQRVQELVVDLARGSWMYKPGQQRR